MTPAIRHATAAALAVLCLLQALALWRAPAVYYPAQIKVRLAPGASVTLGREALAAPQAAASHLAVRRDSDGTWWVRNVSAGKQVLLQRQGRDQKMGAVALQDGHMFRAGAAVFQVEAADPQLATFNALGHTWRYDGATLLRNGAALAPCPGTSLSGRIVHWWNRAAPLPLTRARALQLGGNLDCGNRIGIPRLTSGSAQIQRSADGLMLSNGAGAEAFAPLMLWAGSGATDLSQREEKLAGVGSLTVGRTRMAVSLDDQGLVLKPQRNVALATARDAELPLSVQWRWQHRSTWALPPGPAWRVMAGLLVLLAAGGGIAWARGRWPFGRDSKPAEVAMAAATAMVAIAGLGAMLFQRAGTPPGAGISMLIGWGALWCCLLASRRASLATCAGLLLLAAGLLAQLELGLGAMESSWLRHFQKTTALLAIGLGVGAHLRLHVRHGGKPLAQATLERLLLVLAACALAALAVQVVFGDETGVFDLQPVEFAKLALTALAAHCLAIGLGWQREGALLRWLRLGAPAILFAALAALALLQVDDYSPLLLLLVWGMAMALAWSLAARHKTVGLSLAGAGLLAVGAVAWLRLAGGTDAAQWGLYADRFAVWLDPASHPHTGQQLLLAARAIAQGAWWGADNWMGLGALGQAAGSVLHVPAVQDDFAPTFFIHRHGLLGALMLWVLQALFLAGLLHTAAASFAASERARDFRHAWAWRFRCFVLCGGAAFVLGHLLLSWGTNLAIFPIMGQPMSFLSAGGSHLLFFICPLLAFDAASAQSLEEIPSCRSTSNTKSWAR